MIWRSKKGRFYGSLSKNPFSRRNKEIVLNDLLSQSPASFSLSEKMYWLELILQWLFKGTTAQCETRFRFFFKVLEQNPEWKQNFRNTLTTLLEQCGFLSLLTHVGLAVEHGLWGDIANRLKEKIIPIGGRTDFLDLICNVFIDQEDLERLAAISTETLMQVNDLVNFAENRAQWSHLREQLHEALLFLSTHIAHYGISSMLRSRLANCDNVSQSSFFQLAESFHKCDSANFELALKKCTTDVNSVYANMEEFGVSVDVVNRLETIVALMMRIQAILRLQAAPAGTEKVTELRLFMIDVADAGIRGRSVVGYLRRHFYLLSRKIVERNGHSGEHYIARSTGELSQLFRSAMGGGGIVVIMAALKTLLIHSQPAPLFLALGIWVIYATGFLAMQFLGCTLATKIPSFTASRLAEILRTTRTEILRKFRKEFRLVVKSQSIALLGNIIGVLLVASLLSFLLAKLSPNLSLMDEAYAHHVLRDLNPLFSLAVPLGALTGLLLWLSSVTGGWFENWVVFNRIPSGLANNYRLKRLIGEKQVAKLADFVLHQSSGIATNVSLGFLFGFVPLLGALAGLNWNANHVTISTAGAAFAAHALHYDLDALNWLSIGAGLLLIGLGNFAVSFGLALYVAGNSQKMKLRRVLFYIWASLGRSGKTGNI